MSYSRLGNDKCAVKEHYEMSQSFGNYSLYNGAVVNPKYNNKNNVLCANQVGCVRLQQPNSAIGTGSEFISKRVELESNLSRGSNYAGVSSKCINQNIFNQSNLIPFNPLVNDRDLFVSNMNINYEQGFGNN